MTVKTNLATVAVAAFAFALPAAAASAGKPVAAIHASGGTPEFCEFLRAAAGPDTKLKTYERVEDLPFAAAKGALFIIAPRYARGEKVVAVPGKVLEAMTVAVTNGNNRFYVENMLSGDKAAMAFTGLETFSETVRPIGQMTVETDCGRLQARHGGYIPAGRHFGQVTKRASVIAGVSDSIGVHAVFVPAKQRFPLIAVSVDGSRVVSLTRLSPYVPHFMRPYASWRKFYASTFAALTGAPEQQVAASFTKTWPDFMTPSGSGRTSADVVEKALAWHERSGILFAPDGRKGMREAVTSDSFGWRAALRTDCHLMTGTMFVLAGLRQGRKDRVEIGKALVDFMLDRGCQTEQGYFRWFDKDCRPAGHHVYATDHGRSTLAMLNLARATGEARYREAARKAVDAFARWQGDDGLVSVMFDLDNGPEPRTKGHSENPVCYYENVPALLIASEMFSDRRYAESAVRAVDTLAKKFPKFFLGNAYYSVNTTYGRFLMAAASAQMFTERDYSDKINGVLDFFGRNQGVPGGIAEESIRLVVNEEAGVGIGDGSDHIADLLYCNNFSFAGLSICMKMPPARQKTIDMDRVRRIYGKLRDFLASVQISSAEPKFDGAWMRAFDMDVGEYHGLNRDSGWGAYCIETGWTMGTIPLVFMFDGSSGSYFAK